MLRLGQYGSSASADSLNALRVCINYQFRWQKISIRKFACVIQIYCLKKKKKKERTWFPCSDAFPNLNKLAGVLPVVLQLYHNVRRIRVELGSEVELRGNNAQD